MRYAHECSGLIKKQVDKMKPDAMFISRTKLV